MMLLLSNKLAKLCEDSEARSNTRANKTHKDAYINIYVQLGIKLVKKCIKKDFFLELHDSPAGSIIISSYGVRLVN